MAEPQAPRIVVRDAAAGERAAIRAVVEAAFGRPSEADLVERLQADGAALISLVAAGEQGLVGHILLSRMTAPFRALALAPLAVIPTRRRRGIGSLLVQTALDRGRRLGWDAVFVLGDPTYYARFGFDARLAVGFTSAYAGPHLMVAPLHGSLPAATGQIDYAAAFAALG